MTAGGDDNDDADKARKPVSKPSIAPPGRAEGGSISTPPPERARRPITIQIPPKRTHAETQGRLPERDSRTPPSGSFAISLGDKTPLPAPLPHHVADPTLPNRVRPAPPPLPPGEADDAAATLRAMETADTGDLDIGDADTAPQDPMLAAAAAGAPLSSPRDAGEGPFFASLPADRRAAVLARFHRRQLTPGMLVLRQGETAHPLYLVARGLLEVRAERAGGELVVLDHARDGDVVGEIGLLGQTPSPIQVIAATSVDVFALAAKDFYDIVGAFPALWTYLRDLSERRQREYEAKLRRG
jgi:hypothetical protein